MAARNLSGRCPITAGGVFQRRSASSTPTLLIALTQNGSGRPTPVIIIPPRAGPTARLTFTPMLFAAIAALRADLGTSCGTTACHAGAVKATAVLQRNVRTTTLVGFANPRLTTTAKTE